MNPISTTLLSSISVFLFARACIAGHIVIDDFTEGAVSYSLQGQDFTSGLDADRIVGGARFTRFDTVGAATTAAFHIGPSFEITADPVAYKYFNIGYGLESIYPHVERALELDLSNKSFLQFEFQASSVDLPAANSKSIVGRLRSPSGAGVFRIDIEDDLHNVLVPLSPLIDQGIDLSNVSSIEISSIRCRSSFLLNRIVAVPEPPTAAMTLLSSLLVVCRPSHRHHPSRDPNGQ